MTVRTYQGKQPNIGKAVFIDDSAVVIGDVTLGDDVSLWPGVIVRADVSSIEIGAVTNVQDSSVLHGTHDGPYSPGGFPLLIGTGVTIGHRAVVHACTVGDYTLIGMGSILMDGVVVEDHVVVGAGTLVPTGKRLKSGYLYVGSPAKQIRPLTDRDLAFLKYSAEHYQQLKNKYLEEVR